MCLSFWWLVVSPRIYHYSPSVDPMMSGNSPKLSPVHKAHNFVNLEKSKEKIGEDNNLKITLQLKKCFNIDSNTDNIYSLNPFVKFMNTRNYVSTFKSWLFWISCAGHVILFSLLKLVSILWICASVLTPLVLPSWDSGSI